MLFPAIKMTSAPDFTADFAISKPILPDERFPIYLTGSIGSSVPPAVTIIFFPLKIVFPTKNFSISAKISIGSGKRPFPIVPQAKFPDAGSKISTPRAFNIAKFACVAGFSYIFVFIDGQSKIFLSKAKIVVVSKSSAIPCAIFAKKLAVAGAITIKSAKFAKLICATLKFAASANISTDTAFCVIS